MVPSAMAAPEAGRQRPPINREIQVSEEPSGSLATGAEVGQRPQWAAVGISSFPSSILTMKGNDPHSLGPGPHPGLPPLLTGEMSIPFSPGLCHGRLLEWVTEAASGEAGWSPGLSDSLLPTSLWSLPWSLAQGLAFNTCSRGVYQPDGKARQPVDMVSRGAITQHPGGP